VVTPFQYQIDGVKRLWELGGRALLADEMGLGKSCQAVRFLLQDPTTTLPAVVVCPAVLKFNWQREAAKHGGMSSCILEGRKANVPPADFPLYVINYDILPQWEETLRKYVQPKTVIFDECQYITNRKAKRTKASFRLASRIPYVLALSGTPLTNRPAELWTVLHMLRPRLFPYFWDYAQTYCSPRKTPWGWDFSGSANLDVLHNILSKSIMVRRRKVDVFKDLPPKRRIVLPVEIENRREYEYARNDFLRWMRERNPDQVAGAERAEQLSKLSRLKRLAALLKVRSVVEWIQDFLSSSDGKIIVFAIHKSIIGSLQKEFSDSCVVIDGSTSPIKREAAVDKFQNDRNTRVFIGNIVAAGKGLSLTTASTVVFAELSWTPGEHSQAEDRCWARVNDMHEADVFYLVAINTIEEKLLGLIQKKQNILNQTLDGDKGGDDFDIYNQLTRELLRE
jgi:SWI/SNF-related matrix-associated actin-dependent regulator 1 of chromatin subfamily A